MFLEDILIRREDIEQKMQYLHQNRQYLKEVRNQLLRLNFSEVNTEKVRKIEKEIDELEWLLDEMKVALQKADYLLDMVMCHINDGLDGLNDDISRLMN